MGLNYLSLDAFTRKFMLQEFQFDIDSNNCYLSKRFNDFGKQCFIEMMPNQILNGTDDTLSEELRNKDCFNTHEERKTASGVTLVKVPITAPQTFAEGEFNRFYLRGICLRAIEEGNALEIYRARISNNPRPESEVLIGTNVNPDTLLADLRDNKGVDTALGLPNGPNSGLSVKIV